MNSEKGVAVNIDGDILNHIYCTCGRNVNNIKNILAEYVSCLYIIHAPFHLNKIILGYINSWVSLLAQW